MIARAWWFVMLASLRLAACAFADPVEPPPEAGEGDWSVERADSLAPGWVETTFSTGGRVGTAPRTGERMRFSGDGAEGAFRAGDDPLRGGRVRAPMGEGALQVGGIAPRWGRGLVLGAAAQPWSAEADDRGDGGALRGHAGDGALYRARHDAFALLAAHYGTRSLAGARVRAGTLALGVLASAHETQGSLALATRGAEAELAGDRAGRWRAEGAVHRAQGALELGLRARGGTPAFRSLAEPRRAGPSRLAAAQAHTRSGAVDARAQLAWWGFGRGVAGALGSLDMQRTLRHHAAVAFGCDEQHGTRRDPALVSVPAANQGMRQGWWCAWRGRKDGRALELRHELRGGRAFAQQAVRRALTARGESTLPYGGTLSISQSAWSTRSGETLYLSDSDGDQLTLHAANGLGRRTKVDLAAPLLGGRARGSVQWTETPARGGKPAWKLEWTRRMRQ